MPKSKEFRNFVVCMEFIDTHTHLADEAFSGEEDAAVARALEAGVTSMLMADVDSAERGAMYELCSRHPGVLFPMVGLYPGSVGPEWQKEVDEVVRWKDRGAVAVGEIGLDYHYGADTAVLQKEAFRVQLELAAEWDLPVNIHLREATEDFFSIMEDCRSLGLRGNLHAFSGSAETFRRLSRYGDWYVGIGGVLTFRNAGIAQAVKDIPLERILLETDSPYLTPVPYRGRRNESSNIPVIAARLAEIKGVPLELVAETTSSSARRLFKI